MAGGTEVGTAYVTVIPKAEGFSASVASMSEEAGGKAGLSLGGSVTDALKSTVGSLVGTGGEMGGALSKGMESFMSGAGKAGVVGAVAAIGAAAVIELESVGREFDKMTDTIIVGTGASGEALEQLRQSAMSVSQDVAVSFADSGDIIQDFSTRLGLSGEELEGVSTHAAKLDEVLGGVNYDKMATMFNVWGVSADTMNSKMDYMFGVAQNTGIGFDQLTSIMQSSGPTLQNLGFSFEEAANMAGLLDKSGIDASSTMSKMSKALVELSEPGESAQDAFRRTVEEMQGFLDAGDKAAALDLASQVFGTRGAAQFVGALQSGAMNMDALSDAALGASGSIDATYEATESWPQLWQRIQNSVSAALEPLGSAVFQGLSGVLDGLSSAMTTLWTASEPLREELAKLGSTVGSAVMPVVSSLGDALLALATVAVEVLGGAFSVVNDALSAIGDLFKEVFEAIFGEAEEFPEIGEIIRSTVQEIRNVVGPAFEFIKSIVSTAFSAIRDVASRVWPTIKTIVVGAVNGIKSVIEGISSVVSGVSDTFGRIRDAIARPIEAARGIVRSAIDTISGIITGANLRLPDIKLPHFNIYGGEVPWGIGGQGHPPRISIDWYAHGGIVDGAHLIGAGEAGPEAIVPLSGNYMAPFARAIAAEMGGAGTVNNYTINGLQVAPDSALAGYMERTFTGARRLGRMHG